MSNKDKYEYPDGSSSDKKYGIMSKEGRTESLIPPMLRDPKSLAMAVGAGLLFYLVTHLLSYSISSRKDDSVKADVAVQSSHDKISEISDKIRQDNANTASKLNSFSNKVETIVSDSQDNARHLRENDQKIAKLSDKLSEMSENFSKLSEEISVLNVEIQSLKAKKVVVKKKPKLVKKVRPIKLENYNIRAMIKGRAWVQSDAGHYVTVKVGDRLSTYGTILNIDYDRGLINTSSGREIKYEKSN